jgi:hypothetical protein
MDETTAPKFPFKTSLAASSSIFLESQLKGFWAMLFFNFSSIWLIFSTVSIILSSLVKVALVRVQVSLGLTFKINQVSRIPPVIPIKLAIKLI